MGRLEGKTALITGASSGYGRGTAYAFAQEGCNLVITARREERLREVKENCEREYGVKVVYYAGDAREEETAVNTIRLGIETFGKIDILINNAGIGRVQTITEATLEDYDLIMDTNVRSAFAFSKHIIPEMLKQHYGRIIMVSSCTGINGRGQEAAYTASKFAVRGLAQSLNMDYLKEGIAVATFCPHAGITEFEIGHGRDAEEFAKTGFLTPEDVGNALLTMCLQTGNCYVAEMRLASNNVVFW